MSQQPEQKIVSFPIKLGTVTGTVKLMFTKVDGEWCCHLADHFMQDLEDALEGKMPRERVRWVDIPNLSNK